jgi:hypothetical protein
MPDIKEVGGAAVATVNVPAHKREIVIAHSAIEGCAVAAVEAWNKVKGKDDASFADAVADFKATLINHAESVYKTGKVLEGDTSLARFEQEVAKIRARQAEAKKAAKAAEEAH